MSFGFSTGPQLPELIWTLVVWNLPHGLAGRTAAFPVVAVCRDIDCR